MKFRCFDIQHFMLADETAIVKLILMQKLTVYEEQLYGLLTYVRNDKSEVADDGKEKENLITCTHFNFFLVETI